MPVGRILVQENDRRLNFAELSQCRFEISNQNRLVSARRKVIGQSESELQLRIDDHDPDPSGRFGVGAGCAHHPASFMPLGT